MRFHLFWQFFTLIIVFVYRMAPKAQKRKPTTKRTDKSEVEIMSEPRHNMIAYLDPEDKLIEYKGITKWLRESRINHANTHQTNVYKSLIKAFWDSAEVVEIDGKEVIRGRVNNLDVVVSVEILNTMLQLGDDPDASYFMPIKCQRGCLLRMMCVGDILGNQLNKSCGYDMANNDLVGLMVALVLNKPFNISKYIFAILKENLGRTGSVTGGSKFWMYPRFLQMIMNVQHPDLPKDNNDVLKINATKEISLKIFKGYGAKSYKESDPPRKLFGFLDSNTYVAPANDKWRHDNSDSDNEEPTLKKMIEDKFSKKSKKGEGDNDDNDDEGSDSDNQGGDGGVVGASGTGSTGGDQSKQSGDDNKSDSDDNPLEPGYERYVDAQGVRQIRRIRTEQDEDYVPSDTESEKARKKQVAIRRKKKSRKSIGASQTQPASTQSSEPAPEAVVSTNLGLTAEETEALMSSPTTASEPPPTTTSIETPPVQPPTAQPQHATSSSQSARERVQQQSVERRGTMFERMSESEKVNFLLSQLQAAALQINRHTKVMSSNRQTNISQQLEINSLKEVVQKQHEEIERLRAENAQLRAADNARGIDMNRLKERSTVKRDHDSEDPGNPDVPTASAQPEGSTSTQIVIGSSSEQIVADPVASDSTQEEREKLEGMKAIEDMGLQLALVESVSGFVGESSTGGGDMVLRSEDLALQVCHPVTGEELEEGEIIFELSSEQILASNEMKIVEDDTIDKIPSEPEVVNLESLEEIVFKGDGKKSTYVHKDGTEFNSYDGDRLCENVDEIYEKLKSRVTSAIPIDTFEEWRKQFLAKFQKPAPPPVQVDYLKYQKDRPQGKILSWMFVKDIHCMAVKRENGIQYFNSLLSILTLPFYDVAALAKLKLINRSNFEGATLFARKLRIKRRKGWKDELYKPQFPMHEQIKYALDPDTNTARYKLVYQPVKVMDKIPLMPMKQDVLGNMKLGCYDSDTHEAVIVFKNDEDNF
ncbi:hypothetical protein HanXRQr2_Chr14g0642551 [Helianthus annuus]|uniref:Uncharacterized protein n=1 Tax=Helianthus annuus TaxID=4232 RepID=A0A9K3E9U7_HELAN|nr:hypothetical protein HanXRQr2_Chr14g0642551 [Helianthus annuus]KAJ0485631.1 hypothetical protein HanHA89_Chr14g0570491 [Helianthus annuus]KAJ0656184.1 hypothetical protein HanLR1_Chr14g0532891 [Helianthus annuus]KAJ0840249.1 hypothetical protein HanPSC8_Chr14g0616451 [Helianthus annuus]